MANAGNYLKKFFKGAGNYIKKICKNANEYIEHVNRQAEQAEAQYIRNQAEQNRRNREMLHGQSLRQILAKALNNLSDNKYSLDKPYSQASISLRLENMPDGENWKAKFNVSGAKKLSRVMLKELVSDINLVFQNLFTDTVQEFDCEIGIARNNWQECYFYYSYNPNAPSCNTELCSLEQSLLKSYSNLYREKGNGLLLLFASDAVQVSENKIVINFKVSNDLTTVYHPNNFFYHVNNG